MYCRSAVNDDDQESDIQNGGRPSSVRSSMSSPLIKIDQTEPRISRPLLDYIRYADENVDVFCDSPTTPPEAARHVDHVDRNAVSSQAAASN